LGNIRRIIYPEQSQGVLMVEKSSSRNNLDSKSHKLTARS
jgi:hypothetical protein